MKTISVSSAARHRATSSRNPPGDPRPGVRSDIQALRALAVASVLVYHLWPDSVRGGFVGVDVFFVISGFLITSHLLRTPPTSPRGLLTFWSRRIRRLLPASLLVLTSTLVASRLLAPQTQWANIALQVKAAALYVVNWRLADDSVDYLAAKNATTPVQHFWSLSVEEQFYLAWPILILLLTLSAAPLVRRKARAVTILGLSAIVVASLGYSISLTASDPARAYFVTPTRIWELGTGGLLAALLGAARRGRAGSQEPVRIPPGVRAGLAWLGLAAIVWTCLDYSAETPFPGWHAAVPVLGAAMVIMVVAPPGRWSPSRFFDLRPVQYLGDISYSLYLWHWPLIVLVPDATGHPLTLLDKLTIVVVSILLAAFTKTLVEDRFRSASSGIPLPKPYIAAAIGMSLVVGGSLVQLHEVHGREATARRVLSSALAKHQECFGAAALAAGRNKCPQTTSGPLTPDPLAAASDKSDAYGAPGSTKDCFSDEPDFPVITCRRGDPTGATSIALVGNSHAGQWLPALEQIAGERHWKITTYLGSDCAAVDTTQSFDEARASSNCLRWATTVTAAVARKNYDLVVYANRQARPALGDSLAGSGSAYERGYRATLATLESMRSPVAVIRDTTLPGHSIPDCLSEHPEHYDKCDGLRSRWLSDDSVVAAIRSNNSAQATLIDMTKYLCPNTVCPAEIGGVPVYFDNSHMTATYAATLAPDLAPFLIRAMR